MTTKTYSEKMTQTKLMIDGLREMQDTLPAGVKPTISSELEVLRMDIERKNTEQESLKSALKIKTEELNVDIKKLDKLLSDTKKRIKLDYPQGLWKKFGIQDKR